MRIVARSISTKKASLTASISRHAKHLLVPHKANKYQPHLIRWKGLVVVVALIVTVQLGYGLLSTGKVEVLGRTSMITTTGLLDGTNRERKAAGLGNLKINDKLTQAAFMKAQDMFINDYWAHDSPTGVTPWKWLGDVNYNYDVAGENLAKNFTDSESTIAAWMGSAAHKANILDNRYQDVGFAIVEDVLNGKETTIVVAYYGRPAADGAVAAASTQKVTLAPSVKSGISNPVAYIGSALQSLSPATLGVIAILTVVGIVALVTQHFRTKLPKGLQKSWKLHHGAYKAAGVGVAIIVIILSTGGGQI
jgi:hypothetical protein